MRTPYRLGLAGIAALSLLTAACGSSSGSSSGGGFDWSKATSASAGGGMTALVAAAKKEGTLNVIALPADWANYGTINQVYAEYFPGDKPARFCIQCGLVKPDALVEIATIAHTKKS